MSFPSCGLQTCSPLSACEWPAVGQPEAGKGRRLEGSEATTLGTASVKPWPMSQRPSALQGPETGREVRPWACARKHLQTLGSPCYKNTGRKSLLLPSWLSFPAQPPLSGMQRRQPLPVIFLFRGFPQNCGLEILPFTGQAAGRVLRERLAPRSHFGIIRTLV